VVNLDYDINRPWETLDKWQEDYCFHPDPNSDNFLLCGRQVGKTTAMSIRAVELCVHHYKKGEFILINSITEKQAYHMLAKSLVYAKEKYYDQVVWKGKNKPTKHVLNFKNGTGILCYAAGDTGEGLRGFTIKKLMSDEGSRMSEEYFIATLPALSVVKGSMDISSTPSGKLHKDGSQKYFYKCSLNNKFKKYYISAEDCPRHTKEFLEEARKRLSKLAYAQEMLAVFTDELKRLFPNELIKELFILKRPKELVAGNYFLGCDVAGFGLDDCTYEIFRNMPNDIIYQVENLVEKRNYTTDTSDRIIALNKAYNTIKKNGIDDGGIGFGVMSELLISEVTRSKTIGLNNASREVDYKGNKSRQLLKEDMYFETLKLMEQRKLYFLDDDEIKESFASIQLDEDGKVFGYNKHIAEGAIRGIWCAIKYKGLNIFVRPF